MADTERPPDALAGWPTPWRVVAVLTGGLSVGGAFSGRPPYEYRACSAPAGVSLITAVLLTFSSATYLTPSVLQSYGINMHLAIGFELVSFVASTASLWLTATRGRGAARLLRRIGDLLSTRRQRGFPSTVRSWGRYVLLAAVAAVELMAYTWKLYQSGNVLSVGINTMPDVFSYAMSIMEKL